MIRSASCVSRIAYRAGGLGLFRLRQGFRLRPARIYQGTTPDKMADKIGFELGLIGFVFPESEIAVHFHNPLLNRSLNSFWPFGNWL